VALGSAATGAAIGIAVAVDQDAPERTGPIERTRLTILPGAGLVYDVRDYGAQADGHTDDAAAVQSAIRAASHSGGTVYFPAGTYAIGKTLVCDQNAMAFTLCGAGGGLQFANTPSVLLYTSSADGPSGGLLTFNSSFGFEVCHLAFNYSNPAFRGDLINIDGAPHAADTQDFHIHHCTSRAVGQSLSARSIVRLNKAVVGTISHCHLTGTSGNAIRIGDPGGGYVNAFQVEKCTFNDNLGGHILLGTADGESIVIRDCTFEAGTRTTGIRGATRAADGADNALYSPVIECCWFGDAGAPTTWIDGVIVQGNAYTGTIRGCRFASTQGTHLRLQGHWLVEANSFENGTVYATTATDLLNLVAIANFYRDVSRLFDPAGFPLGSPPSYVSLGNQGADDVLAEDTRLAGAGTSGVTTGDIVKALKKIGAIA
jgi:hypothetical protein